MHSVKNLDRSDSKSTKTGCREATWIYLPAQTNCGRKANAHFLKIKFRVGIHMSQKIDYSSAQTSLSQQSNGAQRNGSTKFTGQLKKCRTSYGIIEPIWHGRTSRG